MAQAVDYSFSHPSPWEIVKAGYVGAIRYLGWDFGRGPRCISQAEYDALRNAGLAVDLVWETNADMVLRGAPGGAVDGAEAARLCRLLHHQFFVYVAIDFDISPAQMPTANAYLDAFMGAWNAEFYGKYTVIEAKQTGWQCCAWSGVGSGSGGSLQGRRLSRHARLYQLLGYVMNNRCDANEVLGPRGNYAIGTDAPVATKPATDTPTDDGVAWQPGAVLEGTVNEVQADLKVIAAAEGDSRMDPGPVDGVWGENTRNAVVWFQRQHDGSDGNRLKDDGIVGHETMTSLRFWTYIYSAQAPQNPDQPVPVPVPQDPATDPSGWYPPSHPPFPGRLMKHQEPDLITGEDVRQFQEQMNARDPHLAELGFVMDGVFGQQTEDVVRQFQQEQNLTNDGIVGELTWNAAYEAPTS